MRIRICLGMILWILPFSIAISQMCFRCSVWKFQFSQAKVLLENNGKVYYKLAVLDPHTWILKPGTREMIPNQRADKNSKNIFYAINSQNQALKIIAITQQRAFLLGGAQYALHYIDPAN